MNNCLLRAVAAIAFLALPAVHAQVFKCSIGGKSVYQQAPCEGSGGAKMDVRPAMPAAALRTAPASAPVPVAAAAPVSAPAPAPVPVAAVPAPVAAKSELEQQAEMCLAWYQPLLRDPQGAYYRNPSFDRGVFTFTIYATNGYGGYVSHTGKCEIKNGALDHYWTKIHAERLKW